MTTSHETPSEESVRYNYALGRLGLTTEPDSEFDLWLVAHDAEAREQIAAEIEAAATDANHQVEWYGMYKAARIAKGER